MKNERNETFTEITTEDAMKKLAEERNKILEAFAKAYLAETGLNPSEVELVSNQDNLGTTIETVYFFRKKK